MVFGLFVMLATVVLKSPLSPLAHIHFFLTSTWMKAEVWKFTWIISAFMDAASRHLFTISSEVLKGFYLHFCIRKWKWENISRSARSAKTCCFSCSHLFDRIEFFQSGDLYIKIVTWCGTPLIYRNVALPAYHQRKRRERVSFLSRLSCSWLGPGSISVPSGHSFMVTPFADSCQSQQWVVEAQSSALGLT